MQKVCTGLLLGSQGSLLAAGSDGCSYLLDAESLRQEGRLPLHPSLTGKPLLQSHGQTHLCPGSRTKHALVIYCRDGLRHSLQSYHAKMPDAKMSDMCVHNGL